MRPNSASARAQENTIRHDDGMSRFTRSFLRAAVGLAHVAPDGHFLEVNERFCALLGYSRNELLATTFQAITHPDDIIEGVSKSQAILAAVIPDFSIEKRYLHKDGSTVWANLTVSLVRDEEEAPDFLVAVVEDITARKQAQDALRAKAAELETLIETVPAAVWFTYDPEARAAHGNRFASRLLGLPADLNQSLSAPEPERPTDLRFLRDGIEVPAEELPLQRAARGEEVCDAELEARAMAVLTEPVHQGYLFVPEVLPVTNHYPIPGPVL
jgi:PAS domain S-box-containing protein